MGMFHPKTIEYLKKANDYPELCKIIKKEIKDSGNKYTLFFTRNNLCRSSFKRWEKGIRKPDIETIDKVVRLIS